jgi:hypothetical protein
MQANWQAYDVARRHLEMDKESTLTTGSLGTTLYLEVPKMGYPLNFIHVIDGCPAIGVPQFFRNPP